MTRARVGVQLCATYSGHPERLRSRELEREWDERCGVYIIEGLDEALLTIGLGFNTPGRQAREPVFEMAQ